MRNLYFYTNLPTIITTRKIMSIWWMWYIYITLQYQKGKGNACCRNPFQIEVLQTRIVKINIRRRRIGCLSVWHLCWAASLFASWVYLSDVQCLVVMCKVTSNDATINEGITWTVLADRNPSAHSQSTRTEESVNSNRVNCWCVDSQISWTLCHTNLERLKMELHIYCW